MSLQFEKQEGNMATLTIERPAEELDKAIKKAYQKIRNQVNYPGFRKGKVPQALIEKAYGIEVFFEDAANFLIEDSYKEEIEGCELEIVSRPDIEVTQIEKGKPFIYTAVVAIKPEVTLGQYQGLEYYKVDTAVTEEEVDRELQEAREMNSRRVPVEDRPAQKDDIVNIDFEGFVDGVAFDGGKAEGHQLTLGSGTFIPGFEDQIEGKNIGEEFDVNVTFPEDYPAEELKGKEAVFKCKLNDIKVKELPELDDEFASEVSEFETLEEYKAEIERLKERNAFHKVIKSTIYSLITIAAAAVLAAVLFLPVLRIYGTSMTPTLDEGQYVLAVKGSRFKAGDVVAFYYNNRVLVKRVIANPGEWVNLDDAGNVYVNNVMLEEPYVNDKAFGECNITLPYQVPDNKIFVMGDYRSTSIDSRNTAIGCVAEDQVVGKIIFRIWPLSEIGKVK